MTDIIDRASELEQAQRQQALANRPIHEPALYLDGQRVCLDCEEPIAEQRIVLVDAVRCIGCQQLHEQQQKRSYGK